jgi:hypothetical protein
VVYRINVISEVSDYSTNSNVVRTWLHDDVHARTTHVHVSLVFGALQWQPRWEWHPLATLVLLVLFEYELHHPGWKPKVRLHGCTRPWIVEGIVREFRYFPG